MQKFCNSSDIETRRSQQSHYEKEGSLVRDEWIFVHACAYMHKKILYKGVLKCMSTSLTARSNRRTVITGLYCCVNYEKTQRLWRHTSQSFDHASICTYNLQSDKENGVANNPCFPNYDHKSFADLLSDWLHILLFSCSCHQLSPHYTFSERLLFSVMREMRVMREAVMSWSQLNVHLCNRGYSLALFSTPKIQFILVSKSML